MLSFVDFFVSHLLLETVIPLNRFWFMKSLYYQELTKSVLISVISTASLLLQDATTDGFKLQSELCTFFLTSKQLTDAYTKKLFRFLFYLRQLLFKLQEFTTLSITFTIGKFCPYYGK